MVSLLFAFFPRSLILVLFYDNNDLLLLTYKESRPTNKKKHFVIKMNPTGVLKMEQPFSSSLPIVLIISHLYKSRVYVVDDALLWKHIAV